MLSIIIPTLNEEKYLPLLLGQIKKQNFKEDYEIIVADAGSRDKTVEIARSFGCKIVSGGLPPKGRNEGAKIAKGEIFLFLDADNIYLPDNFLTNLLNEFKKRNLGVASFTIYPDGNGFDKFVYKIYNFWVKLTQRFFAYATNAVLVKREVFEKIGGFDEEIKIGEDHDFAKRAAKIAKFGFIETEPVLTSTRRFERDGRFKTYSKYLLAGLYMLFLGPVKSDIFEYRFDGSLTNKNNEIKYNCMELPKQKEFLKLKAPTIKFGKTFWLVILVIFLSSFFGFVAGLFSSTYFADQFKNELSRLKMPAGAEKNKTPETIYLPQTSQEEAIIKVVKEASPAVVSIIVTKDLPILEEYYISPFKEFEEFFGPLPQEFLIPQYRQKGTEKKEIGGGTGFIISEEGMILTNAHVVSDKEAEYTVLTNDGKKYPAKVLARDTFRDLAIIKIENQGKLPTLKLGDSDKLQIGQTVIAIGNALGEFRNTVSVGVISGLRRTVTAGGGGLVETLEDVIQTDAAINKGNSGGPLLNLKGEVIGVNFAMAEAAENIGFAIPINSVKRDIEQMKKLGKIVYPFLGVRYVLINKTIQQENNLPVDYGAWVIKGASGEAAIYPGSAAEKAGLKEKDIILEFNGEKITTENTLAKIIMKYNPGDKITLKILRNGQEKNIEVTLGERSE
jgi:S1-C subfamily serine protease/glycosyltransferase involved in cell wall biosynthesis